MSEEKSVEGNEPKAEIMSVAKILFEPKLRIPEYQRPYRWTEKNILDLLDDIERAIREWEDKGSDFKYRIGTIILHDSQNKLDIVDGQQRLISLTLIAKCLQGKCTLSSNSAGGDTRKSDTELEWLERLSLLDFKAFNKESIHNIWHNYKRIENWFSPYRDDDNEEGIISKFIKAFENLLEVVMVVVKEQSEAFQLFDSQNSRGKDLDPTDLLKAYHLREVKDDYDNKLCAEWWENIKPSEISRLYSDYLFNIVRWSRWQRTKAFTKEDIIEFKGITDGGMMEYAYAVRAAKAMPEYQITEPFIAGKNFFDMTRHYLERLKRIRTEIEDNNAFKLINGILQESENKKRTIENEILKKEINNEEREKDLKKLLRTTGFCYVKEFFYCILLAYYDRFKNFDEKAVKNLFCYAMILRVDCSSLSRASIDKYAYWDDNSPNGFPIFYRIKNARTHNEIANITVKLDKRKTGNRKGLDNGRAELLDLIKKVRGNNQ